MTRYFVHSRSITGKRPVRRAVAAVEFALIAPVFFVVILGIVEFGRMMMVQEILTNAARVGARAAILSGSSTTSVQTIITNYLTTAKISGYNTPTFSPSSSSSWTSGTAITVTVGVPWSNVSWTGGFPINESGVTLTASSVMIHE